MRRIVHRATGLVLVVALAIGAPAAALAATDDGGVTTEDRPAVSVRRIVDVDAVKGRALEAIERRLEQIERLRDRVGTDRFVEPGHEAHLVDELRDADRGLRSLAGEIEDAETLAELRELVPAIATDYRIYLVVTPKVWEVLASDAGVAAGEKADDVAERLQQAIDRAGEAGYDVADARAHLDDMLSEAAAGLALADPVAEAVLPFDPADWPDPAEAVLEQGKSDLQAAREWFRQARESAQDAIDALRSAVQG
jgi:hypothetical protein